MDQLELLPMRELSDQTLDAWRTIQCRSSFLQNPFFSPEYSLAVDEVTGTVQVAVERDNGGRVVALLPFQQNHDGSGVPVGFPYSDYHGLIAEPTYDRDVRQLVKRCGLSVWDFHYLPESQHGFQPFTWRVNESPIIDFHRQHRLPDERRKFRKLEREVGPVEFQTHEDNEEILKLLIHWKRDQCRRTGFPDLFKRSWMHDLVARLHRTNTEGLRGALSAMYAGGRLVAAHFGIQSEHTWHCWFPAYNIEFAKYSPGLLLWIELIAATRKLGLHRFDFGEGSEHFKRRFSNSTIRVRRGSVPVTLSKRISRGTEQWARNILEYCRLMRQARAIRQAMVR